MCSIKVHRFSRSLEALPDRCELPTGYEFRTFTPVEHALALHALLKVGYSQGGGWVADYEDWRRMLFEDEEYDPELIFVIFGPDRQLAGGAICWTSAFIKDLVIAPMSRRKKIGSALLRHIFHIFAKRGAGSVSLKVDIDNYGAISLYHSVGMQCVETLVVQD